MTIPYRIKVRDGDFIGTTAFFRNNPLYETLIDLMRESGRKTFKIMMHACSVGAEAYSFIAYLRNKNVLDDIDVHITATDAAANFVAYAKKGIYPSAIKEKMSTEERSVFLSLGKETSHVAIDPELHKRITFIDPVSYVDFETDENFDMVFNTNALIYVSAEEQAETIRKVASYNDFLFVCTGFYLETIKDDMVQNGYEPVLTNIKEIHNAWDGRIIDEKEFEKEYGEPFDHTKNRAYVPAFSEIEDYQYKYCSIFRKK